MKNKKRALVNWKLAEEMYGPPKTDEQKRLVERDKNYFASKKEKFKILFELTHRSRNGYKDKQEKIHELVNFDLLNNDIIEIVLQQYKNCGNHDRIDLGARILIDRDDVEGAKKLMKEAEDYDK